jgi:hypothetical protein
VRSRVLWAGFAAVVLAGAGAIWIARLGFATLRARAMPGFELALPDGANVKEDTNYSSGRLKMGMLAGVTSSMHVAWEPGGLYGDDDIAVAGKSLGATLGGEARPIPITEKVTVPGAQQTRSWALRIGDHRAWSTQMVCGARTVMLTTVSSFWGVERLHRRVAASFRCRPDAAKEQTVGDFPVVFEVEGDWFRLPSSPGQLQITDGQFFLMAQLTPVRALRSETLRVIEAAYPGAKVGKPQGDDWPIEIVEDGEELQGWMSPRLCRDGSQLFVMAFGDAKDRKGAKALLPRVRCRRPDEAPQTWPDLPREAKAN